MDVPPSPYEQQLDLPGGEEVPHAPQSTKPKKRFGKRAVLISIGLVLLVALGYGAYKLFNKPAPAAEQTTQDANSTPEPKTTESPAAAKGTKTFTAETLAVEFNYPDNWTVTEKDGTITVKSPTFDYKSADAGTVKDGYFRIYIRKSARDIDSKYIGRAVAVQPTEKITYTNPATSQRKETELSYFAYDEPVNFAFVMITPGFTLQKSETLGAKYGKEAEAYIIVGGYSGTDNKDDLSFHSVSLTNIKSAEVVRQATEIFKSLKVS